MSFIDKQRGLSSFKIAYLVASRRKPEINEMFFLLFFSLFPTLSHSHSLSFNHWGEVFLVGAGVPSPRQLLPLLTKNSSVSVAVSPPALPSHSLVFLQWSTVPHQPPKPRHSDDDGSGTVRQTGRSGLLAGGTAPYNKCCLHCNTVWSHGDILVFFKLL